MGKVAILILIHATVYKASDQALQIVEHIECTPGVCGGRPRIAGRRIRVQDVAIWHETLGLSPDEIAAQYELTIADVYAALAYYHDHFDEIRQHMADDDAIALELKGKHASKLVQKLTANAGNDSLPPG